MVQDRSIGRRAPVLLLAVGALGMALLSGAYMMARTPAHKAVIGSGSADGEQATPGAPTAAASEEISRLKGELVALRSQMAGLHGEIAQAKDQAKSDGTERAVKDDRTPEQINADDERRHREYMAGVSQAFRQEPVEPRWAAQVSAALHQSIMGNSVIRDFARDVECRSRTCRVVLEENSANFDKLNKQLPTFVLSIGDALPTVSAEHTQDGNGSGTVVLYMSAPADH